MHYVPFVDFILLFVEVDTPDIFQAGSERNCTFHWFEYVFLCGVVGDLGSGAPT